MSIACALTALAYSQWLFLPPAFYFTPVAHSYPIRPGPLIHFQHHHYYHHFYLVWTASTQPSGLLDQLTPFTTFFFSIIIQVCSYYCLIYRYETDDTPYLRLLCSYRSATVITLGAGIGHWWVGGAVALVLLACLACLTVAVGSVFAFALASSWWSNRMEAFVSLRLDAGGPWRDQAA